MKLSIQSLFLISSLALILNISCQSQPVSGTEPTVKVESTSKASFIGRDLMPDLVEILGEPPAPQSPQQKKDEQELREWQKKRTRAMCHRAQSEVEVTVGNLFGKPYGPLDEAQIDKVQGLLGQIREEVGGYIGKTKKQFARKRPYLYVAGLKPCTPTEASLAYPSGHATLSRLYALVIAEVYPELRKVLLERSELVALDRVIAGVHHPSDILAGQKMGDFLYSELAKSLLFDQEIEKLRSH